MATCACLLAGCATVEPPPFSALTWNVGHPSTAAGHYAYRIRHQSYEDAVGAAIRSRAPDVVFLQELLSPARCAAFEEGDRALACHDAARREPAVRRLLGSGYSIACESRAGAACVGVRVGFGTIRGVPAGALSFGAGTLPALPLPPCDRLAGQCDETRCDAEAISAGFAIDTARGPLRLVLVHLTAPGKVGPRVFWGERCRAAQLRQIFEGEPGAAALAGEPPTLIAGDFNLDPLRAMGAAEGEVWARNVGPGQRFRDLAPRAETGTPYGTRRGGFGVATDHVLVDALTGRCVVHGRALGPDPGSEALDAGFADELLPGGASDPERVDHFALSCTLAFD